MPGRTSPQSTFYSSVPSAEKPDRTTVPRARSTVLFPLQRNQTGPQSPEHVLQFCSLIRKARRQQVELLALRRYIGKWSKYVRAYSCKMALHCEVVQVRESVLLHQGVTLWSGPSTWERTLAPRCYIVKWSKYVRAYSCTKVLHCEVVQARESVLLHQGVTLWSGPSTWERTLAPRCYIVKWSKYVVLLHQGVTLWSGPSTWERTLAPRCYIVKWSKYVRAYSCTKVLHCEVVQARESVLLHQGVTLWSGPSTWERTLAPRCYIVKWSKHVRAYSCTKVLHCEVVQARESVLLHQGVTLWSGPSTWERTLAPRCYIVKWSKYVRAYSCTKVLHCEVVQVRESVLLHQGVTLWSGPSTWERTLAPRCYIVKWSKHVRAYSCTKVLHCEVVQARESVLLHQGVTLWSGPSTWERTLAPRCYIVKWSKHVRAYSCTKVLHC